METLFPAPCAACGEVLAGAPTPWLCAPCWEQVGVPPGPVCHQCGDFLASATVEGAPEWRCGTCLRTPPPFAMARVLGDYDGVCGSLVRLLKYREKTALAGYLARRVDLSAAPAGFWNVDLVVPVPLHAGRLRQRGFNQSARVAAALAERLGAPLAVDVLTRTLATPPQVGMRRRQRLRNVVRAFAVADAGRVRGKTVLLVDDVITTGATTAACARTLLRAGATNVHVWAVARQGVS